MTMVPHNYINQNRFATRWKDVLPRATYSSDFAPSDYHSFASITSRTCWAALWFIRRCEKMARWTLRSKRERFLLAWYSQISRKMGKMYNKRWSILWIKHFFHSSKFNVFFKKKISFYTCTRRKGLNVKVRPINTW